MKTQKHFAAQFLVFTPRVIVILATLFVSIFALDSFSNNHSIWQQLGEFVIHLIPSFVLIAFLIIAWKWELVGGIIFTLLSLIFSPIIYYHNYKMNHSIAMSLEIILLITFPFFVAGVFFMASHFTKKQEID
jgi:hypothetical protein